MRAAKIAPPGAVGGNVVQLASAPPPKAPLSTSPRPAGAYTICLRPTVDPVRVAAPIGPASNSVVLQPAPTHTATACPAPITRSRSSVAGAAVTVIGAPNRRPAG